MQDIVYTVFRIQYLKEQGIQGLWLHAADVMDMNLLLTLSHRLCSTPLPLFSIPSLSKTKLKCCINTSQDDHVTYIRVPWAWQDPHSVGVLTSGRLFSGSFSKWVITSHSSLSSRLFHLMMTFLDFQSLTLVFTVSITSPRLLNVVYNPPPHNSTLGPLYNPPLCLEGSLQLAQLNSTSSGHLTTPPSKPSATL